MVEYTCDKCHRIFDHKHNYLYHIRKKKNCISTSISKLVINKLEGTMNIIPAIEEENVDKLLSNFSKDFPSLPIYNEEFNEPNCVYCNKKFLSNSHRNRHMNSNCAIRKKYINLIGMLDKELENLYLENKFLRSKYMGLFGDNYLFIFGTEKFSNCDPVLISNCIKNPYKGIPDFIESYHFNQLEPRYNNVRIKNPKRSLRNIQWQKLGDRIERNCYSNIAANI